MYFLSLGERLRKTSIRLWVLLIYRIQVTQKEIDCREQNVNKLNHLTKSIVKEFKTDMASSINATLSNINRRFEKIKSSVPHKFLNLKHALPHLEVFEKDFPAELEWLAKAERAVEALQKATTIEDMVQQMEGNKVGQNGSCYSVIGPNNVTYYMTMM